MGITNVYNETNPNNPNKQLKISKSGSANYDAVDREQINRATIGAGRIIVDGKEANPNINRDENKAQEITKDVSVDKVGIKYSDNKKEWSVSSIQDILGEDVKQILTPVEILRQKLRDDSKEELTNKKYVVEVIKDKDGNITKNVILASEYKGDISEIDEAHVNGMNTPLKSAIEEITQHHIKEKYDDEELKLMKNGEIRRFVLYHNESGLEGNKDKQFAIADLYESAIDKFGVKGSNKIYSKAAQDLAEEIWKDREQIKNLTMFSQGNIQYYAALHHIEDKYGVGALEKIKISHYNSYGSPLNRVEFEGFLKSRGINANIISKNDKNDLVANFVGNNPHNIERQDGYKEYIQDKYGRDIQWTDWHSQYNLGQKNAKLEYGNHQKIFNTIDKGINIFKIKNYLGNEGERK
ncbi:MAG: hypothetical protein IJG31_06830 [Fusobacterium sp.]|nr:hypothetical protein [Fusobacterium sp.]